MNAFQLPEFLKTLLSTLPTPSPERTSEPPTEDSPPPSEPTQSPPNEEKENRFLALMERHEKTVKKIEQGNKKP